MKETLPSQTLRLGVEIIRVVVYDVPLGTEWHHLRVCPVSAEINNTVLESHDIKLRTQYIIQLYRSQKHIPHHCNVVYHPRKRKTFKQQPVRLLHHIIVTPLVYHSVEKIETAVVPLHRTVLRKLPYATAERKLLAVVQLTVGTPPLTPQRVKTVTRIPRQRKQLLVQSVYHQSCIPAHINSLFSSFHNFIKILR